MFWCSKSLIFIVLVTVSTSTVTSHDNKHPTMTAGCKARMASMTCPLTTELRLVRQELHALNIQVANLSSISNDSTDSSRSWEEMRNIRGGIENLTEIIRNLPEIQKGQLNSTLVTGDESWEEQREAHQVALVCMWIELLSLTRNVTRLTRMQDALQLTNNLRLTDANTQIGYLQQNVLSLQDNLTRNSAEVSSFEDDLKSLHDATKHIETKIASWSALFNETKTIQELKLLALKMRHYRKAGDADDIQSTLAGKTNGLTLGDDSSLQQVDKRLSAIEARIDILMLSNTTQTEDVETSEPGTEAHLGRMADEIQKLKEAVENISRSSSRAQVKRVTRQTCDGFRRHLVGSSCYYIPPVSETDIGSTWWDSRYLCKRADVLGPEADLAAIESGEEMHRLIGLIANHFGGIGEFWLGASDLASEGSWTWAMNSVPIGEQSFTNWGHNPHRSPGQNCMSMLRGFKWADEPCYYRRHPICELVLADETSQS